MSSADLEPEATGTPAVGPDLPGPEDLDTEDLDTDSRAGGQPTRGRQDKALPKTRTMRQAMMNRKTNKSPLTLASSKRRKTLAMSLLVRVSLSLTVWRRLKTTTITNSSVKCKKRDRTSQLIWLP